jgi:XTP/dITP diphosphohydrolase
MLEPIPTIIISTRNAHKAREIRAILGEGHRWLTLDDLAGSPKIVEDAETFEGNARKKAEGLAVWLEQGGGSASVGAGAAGRVHLLADDSGLEVEALDGLPGVHSARFAADDPLIGENCRDADNNRKLMRLLSGVPSEKRGARFRCVVALTSLVVGGKAGPGADAARRTVCFEGDCPGSILLEARGGGGFGYDPLFVPEGRTETFAELGEAVKNGLSHRARALAKLKEWFAKAGAIKSR